MVLSYKDNFDSEIFGKNIFKLNLNSDLNYSKIEAELNRQEIDIIFCFTTLSAKNISILERLGFSLISIRVTYKYYLAGTNADNRIDNKDLKIMRLSEIRQVKISKKSLLNMAKLVGKTSRYFRDNRLKQQLSIKFYIKWIQNSLYNKYANEALMILKGDYLIGLCTLKIRGKTGFIDLIGISNKYQGKGLGGLLLRESVKFFETKQIKDIKVITEGENIDANTFYQKNGFIVNNIELVYHKHK